MAEKELNSLKTLFQTEEKNKCSVQHARNRKKGHLSTEDIAAIVNSSVDYNDSYLVLKCSYAALASGVDTV